MKELIDEATWKAALHYGDGATAGFYERLRSGKLCTTRCTSCGETAFPPRPFCAACWSEEVEWIDLPRTATLYAFSQQEQAMRFQKPDVVGLVEIEGLGTILSKIEAPFEDLSIGMELELAPVEVSEQIVLHAWKPTG